MRVQARLAEMGVPPAYPDNDPARGIFCNRTMNMRAIRAVGFDMDYTLIEYDVSAWEGKAYAYGALLLRPPPTWTCLCSSSFLRSGAIQKRAVGACRAA